MDPLGRRWLETWALLGRDPPDGLLTELLRRYSESHRAYHTSAHLSECFDRFDEASALADYPGEVQLAIWFHDAIYDPRAADNEARSARWAREMVAAVGDSDEAAGRVAQLILATRHHTLPNSGDPALLVDIDLAILGAGPARFDQYERQIRQEYDWVPAAIFTQRRTEILRGLLDRPRIYSTDEFFRRYESAARENVSRTVGGQGGRGG